MLIGERLKTIREAKHLSQAEIEKRTGMVRVYISRVENGHTVPSIETLEKFARGLQVPLYQFFYEGKEPLKPPQKLPGGGPTIGSRSKDARQFERFRQLLSRMTPQDRQLFLSTASAISRRAKRP